MQAVEEHRTSEDGEKYLFDMSQTILGVWFYTDQTKTQEQNKLIHVSLFVSLHQFVRICIN